MNRWMKIWVVALTIVLGSGWVGEVSCSWAEPAPLKALIVTGQNNHNWKLSSPILQQILDQTDLFDVDIATSPAKGEGGMENFKPDFSAYNVVVLDYTGEPWPEETKTAFVEYVRSGGGVVVYHAASNAFPEWKEFNRITGLGGWGGRDENWGPYIRWRDGKVVRDMSPGSGGTHGPQHDFQIVIRDKEHPITKGLPEKWMHAKDELYSKLRGPAENLTVLATAYADPQQRGTGENEPVLFTIKYGEGRVFHTVLGHVKNPPLPCMECVGFITTLQRGAEWAATGSVTQQVPVDFPTATEVRRWQGYMSLASLDELLGKITTYEHGQSRRPLTRLTNFLRSVYDSPEFLKGIEKRFLQLVRSEATPAAKQFICRQLSIIGTEASVPTLAAMLTELATSKIAPSDTARYALERIPGSQVDKALRDALGKTSGNAKVGIINSLGQRRDNESVSSLRDLIFSSDPAIAAAAVTALGKIADAKAVKALADAKDRTTGRLRLLVLDSYLNCADQLAAQGKKNEALAIYKELYTPDEPAPIRSAALRGMVMAMGDAERKKK